VIRERQAHNDMRGRISELLAKAIDKKALDAEMPKGELEMMRQFLAAYGQLGAKGDYQPQGFNGFADEPGGYAHAPKPLPALTFKQLLPTQAMVFPYIFESIFDMHAPMLQPVGGMDAIANALYREVRPAVRLERPVTAIRRVGTRVRIEHGPGTQALEADYCVCTLPANLLARIPNDFSPAKKAAMKNIPYLPSVKVAFESPRFWEQEEYLFGGLAWTDRLNENIIYPSDGFGRPNGILVAAYVAGWTNQGNPQKFAALSDAERFRISRESIEALHPGKSRLLSKGVTVGWGSVPWSEGVGALWPDFAGGIAVGRGPQYAEMLKPEGPIVFAGEHLSYAGLWQEGSALSAHEALKLVQAMAAERAVAA
jgi:monoamine oxidase